MSASRRGFLLGLGVLAAPATLLAPTLAPAAAQSHQDHDQATVSPPSAVAFERTMRALWEDHVTWTRLYIVSVSAGLPDQEATTQRLLRNQVEIGDALKPYYGEAAGGVLTALLTDHILGAADLLAAAKAGDQDRIEAAVAAWYANADEIAAFLSAANPDHWPLAEVQAEMRMHLDLTLAEAEARLAGDWAADVAAYDEVHHHILAWADRLSAGVVGQFPERFA
jgi:hypothetical protein